MSVLNVTKDNFEQEVLACEKTVLDDFYADWCMPCQNMMPEMEAFAEENENVKVCKLNVDESTDLAVTFGVMSIPTVLLFDNGQEVKRFVGAKEKHQIAEFCAE